LRGRRVPRETLPRAIFRRCEAVCEEPEPSHGRAATTRRHVRPSFLLSLSPSRRRRPSSPCDDGRRTSTPTAWRFRLAPRGASTRVRWTVRTVLPTLGIVGCWPLGGSSRTRPRSKPRRRGCCSRARHPAQGRRRGAGGSQTTTNMRWPLASPWRPSANPRRPTGIGLRAAPTLWEAGAAARISHLAFVDEATRWLWLRGPGGPRAILGRKRGPPVGDAVGGATRAADRGARALAVQPGSARPRLQGRGPCRAPSRAVGFEAICQSRRWKT